MSYASPYRSSVGILLMPEREFLLSSLHKLTPMQLLSCVRGVFSQFLPESKWICGAFRYLANPLGSKAVVQLPHTKNKPRRIGGV